MEIATPNTGSLPRTSWKLLGLGLAFVFGTVGVGLLVSHFLTYAPFVLPSAIALGHILLKDWNNYKPSWKRWPILCVVLAAAFGGIAYQSHQLREKAAADTAKAVADAANRANTETMKAQIASQVRELQLQATSLNDVRTMVAFLIAGNRAQLSPAQRDYVTARSRQIIERELADYASIAVSTPLVNKPTGPILVASHILQLRLSRARGIKISGEYISRVLKLASDRLRQCNVGLEAAQSYVPEAQVPQLLTALDVRRLGDIGDNYIRDDYGTNMQSSRHVFVRFVGAILSCTIDDPSGPGRSTGCAVKARSGGSIFLANQSEAITALTLVHEIGHLAGLAHNADRGSLMSAFVNMENTVVSPNACAAFSRFAERVSRQ